jgi:hypothetical protein
MRRRFIVIILSVLLVLALPVLFRKRTVPLASGKGVAVAKHPFVMPWRESKIRVYAGGSNVFSLWGGMFEFPLFIHAFNDGERFLCIYDDDIAVLVFVVDLSAGNAADSSGWPPDECTRTYLAQRATNIMIETKGSVRLPSYREVQETSVSMASLTPGQLRAASFPCADFGVYRFYWSKESLLNAVYTNRHSVWPQ